MIHRLALIIGSIAAAVVLGLGLAATGLSWAAAPVDAEQLQAAVATAPDGRPGAPITRVETKTVYVRPAAEPKVVHVTRHVAAAPVAKQPKVGRTTKVSRSGDDGGEHEGSDD